MSYLIEDETGVCSGAHPHDGYYAGDFSAQPFVAPGTFVQQLLSPR